MDLFILVLSISVTLYVIYSFIFSKTKFWKMMNSAYGCKRSSFFNEKLMTFKEGRFSYSFDGEWKSNNFISMKCDEYNLYIGATFFLDFFIKPVCFPKKVLTYCGIKNYWLGKRYVYRIEGITPTVLIALKMEIKTKG
ncbi:hypothetical protein [Amphritea pacifica]|uniref:DUF2953 domain-containing protein n=1 Tax=Amphritea pacifica TaxID=2811233 RepID=A0ABS2WDT9_9GAMM|nr:hypothetical protein [Amphritea pacifica]MBN0989881.1 hypothetical protein [Amphritea pacifica]